MSNKKNKIFSLDIGTSSIGWAVVEVNKDNGNIKYNEETGEVDNDFDVNENINILGAGVRLFNEPVVAKSKQLLNVGRRGNRITRRRIRRKASRLLKIREHLCNLNFFCTEDFSCQNQDSIFQKVILANKNNHNVFKLRVKALDEKLSQDELGVVLYHIAKYRGFKSSKLEANIKKDEDKKTKDLEASKKDDAGKILKAIAGNASKIEELKKTGKNIRTQIEYLVHQVEVGDISSYHNKSGDYSNCLIREKGDYSVLQEVKLIFDKQREFYNELTHEFEDKFIHYAFYQRKVIFNENTIGKCSLEKEEFRATKGSYSAEKFVALSKLINLRLLSNTGERQLNKEEIIGFLSESQERKKTTYKALRKYLKLDESYEFKGLSKQADGKEEGKDLVKFEGYNNLTKALGDDYKDNYKLLDSIAQCFAMYKDEEKLQKELLNLGLKQDIVGNLLESNLDFKHFINFSHKALYKILPILETVEEEELSEKGRKKRYDTTTARQKAGYQLTNTNHQYKIVKKNNTEELYLLPPICNVVEQNDFYIPNNPGVIRALTQIIKTFNAMVLKYGNPSKLHIELLRELKYGHKADKDTKKRDNNETQRSNAKEYCKELNLSENEDNILKIRLYQEQKHSCPYCQNGISPTDFKDNKLQIDHIIPYSISFSNSYDNKVLVHTYCNQNKGQKTPYLYFGEGEKWNNIKTWVLNNNLSKIKSVNLLNTQTIEELSQGFSDRQMNDTAYITTVIKNYIEYYYKFDSTDKRNIFATKGALTSILRNVFNFKKYRSIDDVNDDKKHYLFSKIIWNKEHNSQENIDYLSKLKKEDDKEYKKLKKDISTYLLKYFQDSNLSEEDDEHNNTSNKPSKSKKIEITKDIENYITPIQEHITEFKVNKNHIATFEKIDKHFIGDKHHAIDAILIALCNPSFIKKIGTLANSADVQINQKINLAKEIGNIKEEKSLYKLKYGKSINNKILFLLKDEDFIKKNLKINDIFGLRENIETVTNEIFVSRAPSRRLMGRIHEDTIYSKNPHKKEIVKGKKTEKVVLTTKKDVLKLNKDDIKNVVGSVRLIETLKEWLENKDKPLPTMPTNNGSIGHIVRRVTVSTADTGDSYTEVRNGLANPDKKIRIDIFQNIQYTKKGKEVKKYAFRPISLADILINKAVPLDIRISSNTYKLQHEAGDENNKFLFSLYPEDLFCYQKAEKDKPKYVYYVSFKNGRIEYKDHDNTEKNKKVEQLTLSVASFYKLQKAEVGVLGEQYVVKNNPYIPIVLNSKNKKNAFKLKK